MSRKADQIKQSFHELQRIRSICKDLEEKSKFYDSQVSRVAELQRDIINMEFRQRELKDKIEKLKQELAEKEKENNKRVEDDKARWKQLLKEYALPEEAAALLEDDDENTWQDYREVLEKSLSEAERQLAGQITEEEERIAAINQIIKDPRA